MAILLYGANHQSAPLEFRERLVVPESDLVAAIHRLIGGAGIDEGLILSTCNRTEVLVHGAAPEAAEPCCVRPPEKAKTVCCGGARKEAELVAVK